MLEGLHPAGRFIPASEPDFNRYAKHLAYLLGVALSDAKEQLAQLYGFSSCHEIHQVFKQKLAPGPFSQELSMPWFFNASKTEIAHPEHLPPASPLYRQRRLRIQDFIFLNAASEEVPARRYAIAEAGFFCAPKVHRRLFARVQDGLTAFESRDEQRALAFLQKDWPIGYWALLDQLYDEIPYLDESPLDRLSILRNVRISKALRSLWSFKASSVYNRITRGLNVDDSGEYYRDDVPVAEEGVDRAGLFEYDPMPEWSDSYRRLYERLGELDEEQSERVCLAIYKGDFNLSQFGSLRNNLTEAELEDISRDLRGERFKQLKIYNQLATGGATSSVQEILHCHAPWPLSENEKAFRALKRAHKYGPFPTDLLNRRWNGSEGFLLSYVALARRSDAFSLKELSLQILDYEAVFYRKVGPVNGDSKAGAIGVMAGMLLVPFDHEHRVSEEDWFEGLDSISAQLNDVWKVLQADYFPKKGLSGIGDFIRKNSYQSIATASIEILPEYRGKGLVPFMFELVRGALEDMPAGAIDDGWFGRAASLAWDKSDPGDHSIGYYPPEQSQLPVGPPAVFIIAVRGGEPERRILTPHLRGSLGRLQKNPADPKEVRKRRVMEHYAAMRVEECDLVCYDPWEWPAT